MGVDASEQYGRRSCPYCRAPIDSGTAEMICPVCGTAHHARCWQANHGCTKFGCNGAAVGNSSGDACGCSDQRTASVSGGDTILQGPATNDQTSPKKFASWIALLAFLVLAAMLCLNHCSQSRSKQSTEPRATRTNSRNPSSALTAVSSYQPPASSGGRSVPRAEKPHRTAPAIHTGAAQPKMTAVRFNGYAQPVSGDWVRESRQISIKGRSFSDWAWPGVSGRVQFDIASLGNAECLTAYIGVKDDKPGESYTAWVEVDGRTVQRVTAHYGQMPHLFRVPLKGHTTLVLNGDGEGVYARPMLLIRD